MAAHFWRVDMTEESLRSATARLTPGQLDALRVIAERIRERGIPPSLRELVEAAGMSSLSVAHDRVRKLERAGLITRSPFNSRSIAVTGLARERFPELFPPSVADAVAGAVRDAFTAGEPLPARVVEAMGAVG